MDFRLLPDTPIVLLLTKELGLPDGVRVCSR